MDDAIAGLGVAFLLGQCGIVSLAQSVFYGIGAYATAYCTVMLEWPAGAGFACGAAVSALIALGVVLIVAELFLPTGGVTAVAGVACVLVGVAVAFIADLAAGLWTLLGVAVGLPALAVALTNPFARGAISGLGVINLFAGFAEMVPLFAVRVRHDVPFVDSADTQVRS